MKLPLSNATPFHSPFSLCHLSSHFHLSSLYLYEGRLGSLSHTHINPTMLWKSVCPLPNFFYFLKAAPDHHTPTTVFDCWSDVLIVEYYVSFTLDLMEPVFQKVPLLTLLTPKLRGSSQCILANVRWALVFFWSTVVFTSQLSHVYHLCPVSFLLRNCDHWP